MSSIASCMYIGSDGTVNYLKKVNSHFLAKLMKISHEIRLCCIANVLSRGDDMNLFLIDGYGDKLTIDCDNDFLIPSRRDLVVDCVQRTIEHYESFFLEEVESILKIFISL